MKKNIKNRSVLLLNIPLFISPLLIFLSTFLSYTSVRTCCEIVPGITHPVDKSEVVFLCDEWFY